MSDKWKTAAIHWEIYGKIGSVEQAWRLKMQANCQRRGVLWLVTSIEGCFVFLLSPWQSEDCRTFSKKAAIKQEQVVKN